MQLLYIEDLIYVSWDPSGDYFGKTDDGFKMWKLSVVIDNPFRSR